MKDEGFTLLEVLVSLALLSIVLAALYNSFFLSQRAMEGIDGSLVRLQECRMALDTIRGEIEALVYSETNKNTLFKVEDRDLYGKQASGIGFTSLSPRAPGLSAISYSVEERDGKMAVIKKMSSAYRKNPDDKGTEVIEDIESFAVEARDGDQWVKLWDTGEIKRTPEEVKVTVTLQFKDRKIPIYEKIRPKIGRVL